MTDYYVAKTGSNSNPGTSAQPKLTIAAGIGLLSSGDTLYVHGGIYDEKIDSTITSIPNGGGSWATATKISAYPGETVTISRGVIVITRSWIIFDGIHVDHRLTATTSEDTAYYISGSDHIRFQNAELQYCTSKGVQTSLGFAGPSTYLEFINLNIHHTGWGSGTSAHHIYFSAGGAGAGVGAGIDTHILVDGCEIHHTNGITFSTGVAIAPQTGIMLGVTVRNCRIHNNGIGLQCYGGATESTIYNNLFYDNGPNPAAPIDTANNRILNNTFYRNSDGIVVSVSGNEVRNNIVFNGGGISGGTTVSNNLVGDPLFVNASAANFNLQPGSPAIDAGYDLSGSVDIDFYGNARPAGSTFDIGAIEFNGVPAPPLPPFPPDPSPAYPNYSQQLVASGGVQPYRWNLQAGSFPAGIFINSSGLIAGIATEHGTFNPTVRVTDSTPLAPNTAELSWFWTL